MQFAEYRPVYSTTEEALWHLITDHKHSIEVAELLWRDQCRPYYCVYPSIWPMLGRIKLDCTMSSLFGSLAPTAFSIRLRDEAFCCAVYQVPLTLHGYAVYGAIYNSFGEVVPVDKGWSIDVSGGSKACMVMCRENETIENAINRLTLRLFTPDLLRHTVKAALSIMLMKDDTEFLQPDVLADDRNRWKDGDEELRRRLEERARRRGKNGWLVGAGMEVIPHYRRPHLGLRWTGEGKKVPKIVPVRGAIVHREIVEKVPTGYLDKERTEAHGTTAHDQA